MKSTLLPIVVSLCASWLNAATGSLPTSASFVRADATTQGNWRSAYGADGYTVVGDQSARPSYATAAATGQSLLTWASSTSDQRGLQKPSNPADRIAAAWSSPTSFLVDVNITDQLPHQVALYFMDWDNSDRSETIDIFDNNGRALSHQFLYTDFSHGLYLVWNVTGHVKVVVTGRLGTAVLSGVFFGGPGAQLPSASASFIRTDTTTAGNWKSAYGAEGYNVDGDQFLNPTYAAPVISGQMLHTWAASTSDVRGLQKPSNPTDRIASAWSSNTSMVMDTNISDQSSHQIALYVVDWDRHNRVETVDVLDGNGTILDTRTLNTDFSGGVYLVWNVNRRVKFRITNVSGGAVLSGIFFGATATASTTPPPVPPPAVTVTPPPAIPQLKTWESRMLDGATQFCNPSEINGAIGNWGVYTEGNVWYYDGTKVYQQIAAYTKNSSWYTCAGYVNKAYTDWVLATTAAGNATFGALGGWRVFPDGALKDFQRTGNANSREAVLRLAYNSAWAASGGGADCELSRETAYMMNALVAAERLGQPRSPLLSQTVTFALGHINQWFVSKSCGHVAPFMVGLTLEALMNYYELTSDTRIPSAIQTAADALWATAWVPSASAFYYDSVSDPTGAPDLNLLIAPAYAWLWQVTGASKYIDEGDQVFAGGVLGAYYWTGKQFSQSYRSSFNYVKWRSAPAKTSPLTAFQY